MGENTGIEWTDDTWNPIVGCSVVSPGCTNCYAMKMAARIERMSVGSGRWSHYNGTTQPSKAGPVWTGRVTLAHDAVLLAPLRKRRPRRIFVNSMGDLFHESVPDDWIDKVFAVMALAPQHTFQVLTKRSARMRAFFDIGLSRFGTSRRLMAIEDQMQTVRKWGVPTVDAWPLPNVWLGVSTEDQARANERIPDLLATPAAVRFVSAEPLLGPIHIPEYMPNPLWNGLPSWKQPEIDWIIIGGESGPDARPMHPDWARSLRDQCAAAGVPFFFKQWGEWKNGSDFSPDAKAVLNDGRVCEPDRDSLLAADRDEPVPPRRPTMMRRVGKRAAGRLLDDREHNDMPEAIA